MPGTIVILEAFAEYLHAAEPSKLATEVLAQWLVERLTSAPLNNVDRVLHCEMKLGRARKQNTPDMNTPRDAESSYTFKGTSDSGRRLLKSLYEYCQSYEQQKWSRFVHKLKASDFPERSVGG